MPFRLNGGKWRSQKRGVLQIITLCGKHHHLGWEGSGAKRRKGRLEGSGGESVEEPLAAYDSQRRELPAPVTVWQWGWTKSAETWNGRAAMLAVFVLYNGLGSDYWGRIFTPVGHIALVSLNEVCNCFLSKWMKLREVGPNNFLFFRRPIEILQIEIRKITDRHQRGRRDEVGERVAVAS
ncbi:hypothetical protein NE237_019460 [Protea cynaroides]|uniref:Uncharacterized protein n=1 Tax=Protea cynaroides TaxID=273540 RepID=A0A9Q0KC26_9MAGN|nr:hypothetical protein NE237_019460 [Protea cynaroides]